MTLWEGNRKKHLTKNPILKPMMLHFKDTLASLAVSVHPTTVLDVGCGEGFTTTAIADKLPHAKITAIELESGYVSYANKHNQRSNVTYKSADLYKLPFSQKFDLVICSEVLEHVEDYKKALSVLTKHAKKAVLFSVPNEPWFRMANLARFKYWNRLGNTPGHLNNWTKRQIHSLANNYGDALVRTSTIWNAILITNIYK